MYKENTGNDYAEKIVTLFGDSELLKLKKFQLIFIF